MNMCTGCGQDFGSLSAFDHHQRWVNGTLTCRDPAASGMHRDSHGRWRTENNRIRVGGVETPAQQRLRVVGILTDHELVLAETEAVAANHDGRYEFWIQEIAEERNRREDARRASDVRT